MKKLLSFALSILLIGVLFISCGGKKEESVSTPAGTTATTTSTAAPAPAKVENVKLGFIGPMTGDYANYGQLISKGAQLAIDEKNATGGIAGKAQIQLIIEDSEGNPEKGLAGIEKLSSSDKVVALVGPVFTG
ncbi:MAG: ABC transporter substrate-binding protein, partial [Sphaerochaetaceae bacterium]|nr:ABC transporter substrate-binding protein [Sphaerochaetaceae bacterium]